MRIAINAISAKAGGARTYLLNLARVLPKLEPREYLLFVPASAAADLRALPGNFCVRHDRWAEGSYAGRLWWEQYTLPRQLVVWGADVLVSVGNFCPLRCPVPVVLLSRNPLYFTPRFFQDLLQRGHYLWAVRHLAMSRLALWSARAARLTVTPTDAMGEMIRSAAGNRQPALRTIPHGFELWPSATRDWGGRPAFAPPYRFLVVSHYNYFRNFETVLRAFAHLRRASGDGQWRLLLTTELRPGLRLGGYDTSSACRLVQELGIQEIVTTLGAVAYDDLPRVYGSVHAVICPAYAESFSHTVVEAMAMGVPVIASDIPVHREVAGDAALFFSPLDPSELVERCLRVTEDEALRARLCAAGQQRAQSFSWRRHFEDLLAAAEQIRQ